MSNQQITQSSDALEGAASALTYSDVHMILALANWPEGSVSLRHNGLVVDAVLRKPLAQDGHKAAPSQIRSTAVGTLNLSVAVGASVKSGETIGTIAAPGHTTPVVAAADGTLHLSIENGSFVEFGQTIGTIDPLPGN